MKIKRFNKFVKESISGTEIPTNPNFSYFGPSYGTQKSPNTINYHDTDVILASDNKFYSEDDYNDMYQNYLKNGGKPLDGFNLENIETILNF
jgi:hypothetical protein